MTTPEARKKREQERLAIERKRLREQTIGLVIGAITVLAVIAAVVVQLGINAHLKEQNDDLKTQAAQSHDNQIHACELGNKHLRRTINQRIVAPIHLVLKASPNPQVAKLFHTVPLAICDNLYPENGDPEPPFYREAKLPPVLELERRQRMGGQTAASGTTTVVPLPSGGGSQPGGAQNPDGKKRPAGSNGVVTQPGSTHPPSNPNSPGTGQTQDPTLTMLCSALQKEGTLMLPSLC